MKFALIPLFASSLAVQQLSTDQGVLARDVFRELIETNTTDSAPVP